MGLPRRYWLLRTAAIECDIGPLDFTDSLLEYKHALTRVLAHAPPPLSRLRGVPCVGNVSSHLSFGSSEIFVNLGTATVCTLSGYRRFPSTPTAPRRPSPVQCANLALFTQLILPDPGWSLPPCLSSTQPRLDPPQSTTDLCGSCWFAQAF